MVTHICAECGKRFEADPKRNRIYCSSECFNSHRRLPILVKNCEHCGLEFKTKRDYQLFCSRVCGNKARAVTKPEIEQETKPKLNTCATCRYCQRTQGYSIDHCAGYRCYECTNVGSKYYRAFLNVDENGINMRAVTWPGCDKWAGKKVAV